ncbi:uncharacterized protein BX663DRAFT_256751 [Cokeromyces recurvatus]|uniref:uncharacterized protein n=1 Tax=Cokeromyces recurvatus TaxID=90255 RepID=UPI002220D91E|nr:uncharacterized protein BX663DRAFT_256751 [Cokeromyces recurvatus]KAI7906232.1 hypothetical protein BX663DRAFT_256751 [Cokeromyces recurvatus]
MKRSVCYLAYLFMIFTTIVHTFELKNTILPPQRLVKRACDFSCQYQAQCDNKCYSKNYGSFLLGVCHDGKCYCGFVPENI